MRSVIICSFASVAWLLLSEKASFAAQDDLTGDQVRATIEGGVKYLLGEQDKETGKWNEHPRHKGGITALCTLALVNAGLDESHPQIESALRLLGSDFPAETNYVISLQIMVFAAANPEKHLVRIQQLADKLVARQYADDQNGVGGWSYEFPAGLLPDSSNSQFALLALHEARLAGAKIDRQVWIRARQYWMNMHQPDTGGFTYFVTRPLPTGSMTCAGIASLIIIDENLRNHQMSGMIECCGSASDSEIIDRAMDWLDQHWTTRGNPNGSDQFRRASVNPQYLFYYLYSIERAGRLSGRRFIGDNRDWYREIGKFLVEQRQPFGGWRGADGHGEENNTNVSTSFALLFLSKGLRPVVIGKYQHGGGSDWDRHPRGVHYLTRELESLWKQKLNWQTIKGNVATTNDLLQAPVLFISGRDNLSFDEQQKQRLKEYVDNGGFIFAEACQGDGCGDNVEFDRQFRELMLELFPNSSLQALPESHPVWTAQKKLLPNPQRPLLAMQTSCRTAVIYCPSNLSCLWQYNQSGNLDRLSENSRKQVQWAIDAGINVITYATNRDLKQKLDAPTIVGTDAADASIRIHVMPKLAHGGGADDAPNAWNNILNRVRFDLKLKIKLKKELIQPTLEELREYPIIVFMHGRKRFSFSQAQRDDLKKYIGRGGFLFADSICGSIAFADAFRNEIRQMFPDGDWRDIPGDHEIWSEKFTGYNLDKVTLREPLRNDNGLTFREQKVPPQMEGLFVDGRIVVILSKYDLSCAMESASASECKGYLKEDAAKIGVNVVLYALQ